MALDESGLTHMLNSSDFIEKKKGWQACSRGRMSENRIAAAAAGEHR
jgi:hypothetical protein